MRFVRDISRHKARKRLNNNKQEYALVPLLFGRDSAKDSQVLEDLINNSDSFDIISKEELNAAKGLQEDDQLWISILGHVFDVKQGSKFYAKGGPYEMLAGRDTTRALASGNLKSARDFRDDEDLAIIDEEILLDKGEMAEAQRWLEYFASHQKYKHVGRLPRTKDSPVDIDKIVNKEAESELDDDEDYEDELDEEKVPPDWHPPVLDDTATCPGGGGN